MDKITFEKYTDGRKVTMHLWPYESVLPHTCPFDGTPLMTGHPPFMVEKGVDEYALCPNCGTDYGPGPHDEDTLRKYKAVALDKARESVKTQKNNWDTFEEEAKKSRGTLKKIIRVSEERLSRLMELDRDPMEQGV